MLISKIPIYLASKSPRRRDMMRMMGIQYTQKVSRIDEKIDENSTPLKNVKQISLHKCLNVLDRIDSGLVIAADTIVVLNGTIIGKPQNKRDAIRILTELSGRMHTVYTGFTVGRKPDKKIVTDYSKTKVFFRELNSSEINSYVKSGSPMDKAGAYGIQDDYGAVFVEKINGCYYNVMGFPASKIYKTIIDLI
jgi:septum formation protein